MTLEQLATLAYNAIETATRPDGSTFLRFRERDDTPDWSHALAMAAHDDGNIMPDDYRYEYMHDALECIADGEMNPMLEPDDATHDLTGWLHSSNNRLAYVDSAIQEMGATDQFATTLMHAQQAERQEVYYQVLAFLEEMTE